MKRIVVMIISLLILILSSAGAEMTFTLNGSQGNKYPILVVCVKRQDTNIESIYTIHYSFCTKDKNGMYEFIIDIKPGVIEYTSYLCNAYHLKPMYQNVKWDTIKIVPDDPPKEVEQKKITTEQKKKEQTVVERFDSIDFNLSK